MHTGYYWCTLHWLDVASTVDSRPTHTHIQARVEGGGGQRYRGLSWVVVSLSRCRIEFWTWAIFQTGERGGNHPVSLTPPPPFWPPPSVATSQLSPKIITDPSMSGTLVIKYINGAIKHHLWEEEGRSRTQSWPATQIRRLCVCQSRCFHVWRRLLHCKNKTVTHISDHITHVFMNKKKKSANPLRIFKPVPRWNHIFK